MLWSFREELIFPFCCYIFIDSSIAYTVICNWGARNNFQRNHTFKRSQYIYYWFSQVHIIPDLDLVFLSKKSLYQTLLREYSCLVIGFQISGTRWDYIYFREMFPGLHAQKTKMRWREWYQNCSSYLWLLPHCQILLALVTLVFVFPVLACILSLYQKISCIYHTRSTVSFVAVDTNNSLAVCHKPQASSI